MRPFFTMCEKYQTLDSVYVLLIDFNHLFKTIPFTDNINT